MKLLLCLCVNLMNPPTAGEKKRQTSSLNIAFFACFKCQSSLNINCVNFVNLLLTIGCSKYRITAGGENQVVFMKNSRVFLHFPGCRRTNVRY